MAKPEFKTRTIAAAAAEPAEVKTTTATAEQTTAEPAVVAPVRDLETEITSGVIKPDPTPWAPFDLVTLSAVEKPSPYAGNKRTSVHIVNAVCRVAGTKIAVVYRIGLSWENGKPSDQTAYAQIPGFGRSNFKTDGVVSTDPVSDAALDGWLSTLADMGAEYFARYQARLIAAAAAEAKATGEKPAEQVTSRKTFSLSFAAPRA